MTKKFGFGLASLLTIAAFAVVPVAAQAVTQHWYRSNAKIAEGTVVPVVTFGGKTNLSQTSGGGEINCRGAGGGTIVNPAGGGPGEGRTNESAFYECKSEKCEAEVKTKTGLEGRGAATTQNNPAATKEPGFPGWFNVLEESEVAGVSSIREKLGEPFETFKTPSPPGMIRANVLCEVAANGQVVADAVFEGELKPEIGVAKTANLNGTKASAPSRAKFNGASTGALHSELFGEGTNSGEVKYLGYNEQEVITVKP